MKTIYPVIWKEGVKDFRSDGFQLSKGLSSKGWWHGLTVLINHDREKSEVIKLIKEEPVFTEDAIKFLPVPVLEDLAQLFKIGEGM